MLITGIIYFSNKVCYSEKILQYIELIKWYVIYKHLWLENLTFWYFDKELVSVQVHCDKWYLHGLIS